MNCGMPNTTPSASGTSSPQCENENRSPIHRPLAVLSTLVSLWVGSYRRLGLLYPLPYSFVALANLGLRTVAGHTVSTGLGEMDMGVFTAGMRNREGENGGFEREIVETMTVAHATRGLDTRARSLAPRS